ncbi:hypothetical protein SETIT_8G098700v2 [Setaria italica]|uniref:WRKY domain-containing protein n=1 Tax=Setaria italica TaxID=4555 RepID=K3ZMF4_SETIT|nr:hypothetical protein SETIT_8G098700v2 [Setaria italica]
MACVPDRDSAMREVAQAYELIKSHQPRLQFDDVQQLSATTNLAQSLLNNAMRALHLALCVMNPQTSAHCGAESSSRSNRPHLFSPSAAAGDVGGITRQQKKGKRRRANEETSWVILTEAPHTDGYVWRKYGEKKINGTHFKRHYFRCSYKYDRGCQATKQIQQQSSNDLPMFQVTYNSEHTCNCTTAANTYIKSDLPQRSYRDNNGTISQMGDAMIRQEQGLLPPRAEVSTVFMDTMSCEEPFVLSNPYSLSPNHAGYHMTSTDDGASDFHYESTDGYIDLEHIWQLDLP